MQTTKVMYLFIEGESTSPTASQTNQWASGLLGRMASGTSIFATKRLTESTFVAKIVA